MPDQPRSSAAEGLDLPRILCLHGGGTNSRIFRAQCRVLHAQLKKSFRLVFADAPWISKPGPDVESVYADWGPFRSWLAHFGQLQLTAAERQAINVSLSDALYEDNRLGATGMVIGLLGFSQGARIAASLLLDQQIQKGQKGISITGIDCRFAILLAGRGPLLSLDCGLVNQPPLVLPTVHVHGLQDPGLEIHRELFLRHCKAGSRFLVEWDGAHRVPIRSQDVAAVVAKLAIVAALTGISVDRLMTGDKKA
ncbi:hypothetical protein BDW75DRAFT_242146 [Aspergillus navahoensis]